MEIEEAYNYGKPTRSGGRRPTRSTLPSASVAAAAVLGRRLGPGEHGG
jgi:hypothetical protein